jgi:inhibitor of the pro-sigma K processing machinery
MQVKFSLIFAYILGIIFLYIIGRLFFKPMKIIIKLSFNTILGVAILLLINFIGRSLFGFHIAINIFSILVTGILGLPGVGLLIAFKFMFAV